MREGGRYRIIHMMEEVKGKTDGGGRKSDHSCSVKNIEIVKERNIDGDGQGMTKKEVTEGSGKQGPTR